jgi:hypothetical protein
VHQHLVHLLSLSPVTRRNHLYRRADSHVTEAAEIYDKVEPGYFTSVEALVRRGYVNHKFALLSGGHSAYNRSLSCYKQARAKLQDKKLQGGLSATEQQTLNMLSNRITLIENELAESGGDIEEEPAK